MADAVDDAADYLPLSILYSAHGKHHRRPSIPTPSHPRGHPRDFTVGDLVWVKTFPFTWWPGLIRRLKKAKSTVLVSFFAEGERPQWFRESSLMRFEENCGAMVRMNRAKVGVEIGLAMEELGRRTMTGFMCPCWRSVGYGRSVNRRMSRKVRKGFRAKEIVGFVRRSAVSGFEGDAEESDAAKVVVSAAQVLAFRRYVSAAGIGLFGGGFRPERLLGSVRQMAVGSGVFYGKGADVALGQVKVFRNFVMSAPGWVFQELTGSGVGLGMDDSEDSFSDSCRDGSESDASVSEGIFPNRFSASFSENDEALAGLPMDGCKILEVFSEISLGSELEKDCSEISLVLELEKDVEMVDQSITNDFPELPMASSVESLTQSIPSLNGQMPFTNCNIFNLKDVLKNLRVIAIDLFYFGSEGLESLIKCILKHRKLTFSRTDGYKFRSSRLFDNIESDHLDRIIPMDDSICDAGLSSLGNFDASSCLCPVVCLTSRFTGDLFREVESACSMEEYGEVYLETTLKTKKEQESSPKVNYDANNPIDLAVSADSCVDLPEITYSSKEKLVASTLKEHKASYVDEMLLQLHCIARGIFYFGKKRRKFPYAAFLKLRELIYMNISKVDLLNFRYGARERSTLSTNSLCDDASAILIDGSDVRDKVSGDGFHPVLTSTNKIDTDGTRPSSLVINSAIFKAKVGPLETTEHVTQKISAPICEIRSQLCLLAINLYYPGSKAIKFVRQSILRYRKIAFHNIPDLSSQVSNNKYIDVEKCEAFTYDPLFQNSVKESCSDNRLSCVEDPTKEIQISLAYCGLKCNQADDSIQSKPPFPYFSGGKTNVHPRTVMCADRANIDCRKETSCGKKDAEVVPPMSLRNSEGSIGKRIFDEPFTLSSSVENLFYTQGDTSHADIDFQGKIHIVPEVVDGKSFSQSRNCHITLPASRKRGVAWQSLPNQTSFCGQTKSQKFQHGTAMGRLYASPLAADDLSLLSADNSSTFDADDSSTLAADDSKFTGNVQQILAINKNIGPSKSLLMKFPKGFNIPSKEKLEKKFGMFGLLDHSKTKIFFYTGVARVVFLHPIDARTAYRYVTRKRSFIHAGMRFWLVDERSSDREESQALSVSKGKPSLNIKPCLKRSSDYREKDQRKKRQVKFVVDSSLEPVVASVGKSNEICHSSVPEVFKQMKPDISGPFFHLLLTCDKLVDDIKKKLGSELFYSYLYRQSISYTALTPTLTDVFLRDRHL